MIPCSFRYLICRSGCWLRFSQGIVETHYNNAIGIISWEVVAKPSFLSQKTDQHLVDHYVAKFHENAPVLEKHLENREFIVGDNWTLADYAVGHLEMFVDNLPIDLKRYPNIGAFYAWLRLNPHWTATAPKRPEDMGRVV